MGHWLPSAVSEASVCNGVECGSRSAVAHRSVIGASCSLPRVPAKVGLPNRERLLSAVGGNASSCPKGVIAGLHNLQPAWPESGHLSPVPLAQEISPEGLLAWAEAS